MCVCLHVCAYSRDKLCVFLRFAGACVSAPLCANWTCQEMSYEYRICVCACIHLCVYTGMCGCVRARLLYKKK